MLVLTSPGDLLQKTFALEARLRFESNDVVLPGVGGETTLAPGDPGRNHDRGRIVRNLCDHVMILLVSESTCR